MGDVLYDAVAFYKHRSEGETNNTFAYMPTDLRLKAFHTAREVLWALDVAWRCKNYHTTVVNFIRFFGGSIHMMMRRYRFVEDSLTIGTPEDESIINETRRNFKLWNRLDAQAQASSRIDDKERARYKTILSRSDTLMFPGLAELLETAGDGACDGCSYRDSYGAEKSHQFGGVQLCEGCQSTWRIWWESFPARVAKAFPEVLEVPGHLGSGPKIESKCLTTSAYRYDM